VFVEIVKVSNGYCIVCEGRTWIGFDDEIDARRFAEERLPDQSAVIAYHRHNCSIFNSYLAACDSEA
jgi:hypothetical protein